MQARPELLDAPDEVEDLLDLLQGERDGRLVEDDQIGVEMHRAPDRDPLALAAGQIAHGQIGVDPGAAKADLLAQQPVGDLLLALDVDEAEAVGDLAAESRLHQSGCLSASDFS